MNKFLKYDDVKIFKHENFSLSLIYTIGHILIAITCVRIITGASLDMAAIDALVEPIINGFWFYFLLVYLNKIILNKIKNIKKSIININNITFFLAIIYTIGHIFIALICTRLLTGATLDLAVIDALVEPIINGFWFFILIKIFKRYKKYHSKELTANA